jgi:hypothetical protein
MKTIQFNTGRTYTENGQRITATLQDNGDIHFVDVDRHIKGLITAPGFTADEVAQFFFNQSSIMAAYDKNEYTDA